MEVEIFKVSRRRGFVWIVVVGEHILFFDKESKLHAFLSQQGLSQITVATESHSIPGFLELAQSHKTLSQVKHWQPLGVNM